MSQLIYLTIFFRVNSQALGVGQYYTCPNDSDVSLKDISTHGKIDQYLTTTKTKYHYISEHSQSYKIYISQKLLKVLPPQASYEVSGLNIFGKLTSS